MTLALLIAFVYSWVLTLVIFAVIPIVMIAGIAEVKALTGHTQSNRKAIEIAGKVCIYICIDAKVICLFMVIVVCTCTWVPVLFPDCCRFS